MEHPRFAATYAKLSEALSSRSEMTNFRKLLVARCEKKFEKDIIDVIEMECKRKEVKNTQTEDRNKILEDELEDFVDLNLRRSMGNIRFIAELFKLRIITAKVIHQCILRLLNQPEDEQSIECLCLLLETVGMELETVQFGADRLAYSSNQETVNSYFSALKSIANKPKSSNRTRFMIQDLVDLRKLWTDGRTDEVSKRNLGNNIFEIFY